MARLHGKGTILSVTGDRAVDQPRVDLAELLVSDAEFGHDAGPELLDNNIIFHDQLFYGLNGRRLFQVQKNGLLAAAQPGLRACHLCALDHRGPVDHQIVFITSAHLEHFRAQICQCHRGVRSGQKSRKIQYLISVECTHFKSPFREMISKIMLSVQKWGIICSSGQMLYKVYHSSWQVSSGLGHFLS